MTIIGGKSVKEFVGTVVSNKMDKTVVISVPFVKLHPLYKKRYTTYPKFYAHDESNEIQEGAKVRVRQHKAISKKKRWMVVEVVK